MAHPTHQRQARLEPRPALDLIPDSAITGIKKEINNESECDALRSRFRSVGDYFIFVVSFIYVNSTFT